MHSAQRSGHRPFGRLAPEPADLHRARSLPPARRYSRLDVTPHDGGGRMNEGFGMSAQRRGDLPEGSAGRLGGIAFGLIGAVLALAGVVSVVTGMAPGAPRLAPPAGFARP